MRYFKDQNIIPPVLNTTSAVAAYLHCNNTLAAHFLHSIGDDVTNFSVSIGRNSGHLYQRKIDRIKIIIIIKKLPYLVRIFRAFLTWAISSGVVTGLESFLSSLMTSSTANMTPLRISTGLAPLLMVSNPSLAIARAKTVAVVVPSPASSFVLLATSCTSLAPMFLYLSFKSILLATVTPSLVTLGLPQLCSMITVRPWGREANLVVPAVNGLQMWL